MSPIRSTEALVERMVARLEPVRPVPSLGRQGLVVGGIWLATAALATVWLGVHPLVTLARSGTSAALAVVLALVGSGGLAMGLASRIPGRERIARIGAGGLAVSLLATVAVGLARAGSASDPGPLAAAATCAGRSLLLGIPAAVLALALARRGAPWRPRTVGLGIALGASGLGGLLVHLSCPSPVAWHWILGHVLLPASAGVALGLLGARFLERTDRRSA